LIALALVVLVASSVERYALIVGHNAGARDEPRLKFAEDDAAKLYDVLADVGGFSPEDMTLLRGKDAASVRRALIAMNERIRDRMADKSVEPILLVFYSGHADQRSLHLGGTELELAEIEQLVRGSAAQFRLLIVDACRSGSLTHVKGGSHVAPFPIDVEEKLAGEGLVYLTSSALDEDAQESDALKGSFFTHYLISGMLGAADADGDGKVLLEEAYRYAYEQTLRASSRTMLGMQHPTFEYSMRGRGDLVMTTLDARSSRNAKLSADAGRTYLIMQSSSEGPVVGEIGSGDRRREISVKPGRYFVRSRGEDHLLEGEVVIGEGSRVELDRLPLSRIDYARLVRKGAADSVQGMIAGYEARTALRTGDGSICQGAFLGYTVELESVSLVPRAGACRATFNTDELKTREDEIGAELEVKHAWDLSAFTIETGMSAGVSLLRQTFTSANTLSQPTPDRSSLAPMASALWSITRDLPEGFYASAQASALVYVFKQLDDANKTEHLGAVPAGRLSLALGKRF
jgi:hypothetical protein